MNAVIIYKSKTGFTRQYAQWLSQQLGCEAVPYESRQSVDLTAYDTVIFGGSLHAGAIKGVKWFKQQSGLKDKRKIIFAVGAMPAGVDAIETTLAGNFTAEERKEYQLFYLPGGLRYEQMGFLDQKLMKVFAKMLAKRTPANEEERAMADVVGHSYDLSDQKYLEPAIAYIKG